MIGKGRSQTITGIITRRSGEEGVFFPLQTTQEKAA